MQITQSHLLHNDFIMNMSSFEIIAAWKRYLFFPTAYLMYLDMISRNLSLKKFSLKYSLTEPHLEISSGKTYLSVA